MRKNESSLKIIFAFNIDYRRSRILKSSWSCINKEQFRGSFMLLKSINNHMSLKWRFSLIGQEHFGIITTISMEYLLLLEEL